MPDPPSGTVTFLFTDIEGSTKLWDRYPKAMAHALERHDRVMRNAIETNGGFVFKTIGDAFCAAFADAPNAVRAAVQATRALKDTPWLEMGPLRARIGLHTGEAEERDQDYFGPTLNRAARIMSAGYGEQILLSEITSHRVRGALPVDVGLRDLGQHRLRDLLQPEHLFQIIATDLRVDFPPLRSIDAFPNNLPNQLTTFIGRERELSEIKRWLNKSRLVTLTGAGGTGKTRLSIEAGGELLSDFPDGVWLVELAPLSDSSLVIRAVATTLGLREEPGRQLLETLKDYLDAKQILLILDNCEHLILACARLAEDLLKSCPNLRILASSREPLGIPGETTFRIPSLAVPEMKQSLTFDQLTKYEAVRLFIDRAVNLQPNFVLTRENASAVVQIVCRLEGIPLAIELGVARITAIPVEKLAARLDDQFNLLSMGSRTALPRQQTLKVLIDWSYDLLSMPERMLLRRLSVFVGGWTLEAAEFVCADAETERLKDTQRFATSDVLDLLTQLVNKSLALAQETNGDMRYRFLEPIRQYAFAKLVESGGVEDLRTRHCDWFLQLAEQAEPHLRGGQQLEWLDKLDTEHDNILAALEWLIPDGDAEKMLRFVGALWYFWLTRGYWTLGRDRLERALELPKAGTQSSLRTKVLEGAAYLALRQYDSLVALKYFEESLNIAESFGDVTAIAHAMQGLGTYYQFRGEYQQAYDYLTQALESFRKLNIQWGEASALLNLGTISLDHGNPAQAQSYYEASLAIFRVIGDRRNVARIFGNLGRLNYLQGDYVTSRAQFEKSLAIYREMKDKSGIAYQLDNLGEISLHQGDYASADSQYKESLTLFAEIKNKRLIADLFFGLASVATALNKPQDAARLLGAGQAVLDALGVQIEETNRVEYGRIIAAAKGQLDEASFVAAWNEGKTITLEDAIALALGRPRNN